jgi:hypothetical protein
MPFRQGTVAVTVLYPRDETSTFDPEYYLSTHFPMAEKAWKPHGLLSWVVTETSNPPAGKPTPYSIQTLVTWEARGESGLYGVYAGLGCSQGQELLHDVPNFGNRMPEILIGTVKGSA